MRTRSEPGSALKVAPDVLKLKMAGKSAQEITKALGLGRSTVSYILYGKQFSSIRKSLGYKRSASSQVPQISSPEPQPTHQAIVRFAPCEIEISSSSNGLKASIDGLDHPIDSQQAAAILVAATALRSFGVATKTFVAQS